MDKVFTVTPNETKPMSLNEHLHDLVHRIPPPIDEAQDQQAKCQACQECCEYVEIPITMLSLEVVEYFIFRGNKANIDPKNGVMSIRLFDPCQHLTKDGCGVYESRPWTCRTYMCDIKDKSIKDLKDAMFEAGTKKIMEAIQKQKEKSQ